MSSTDINWRMYKPFFADQDIASSIASESLSAMTLDEWSFWNSSANLLGRIREKLGTDYQSTKFYLTSVVFEGENTGD